METTPAKKPRVRTQAQKDAEAARKRAKRAETKEAIEQAVPALQVVTDAAPAVAKSIGELAGAVTNAAVVVAEVAQKMQDASTDAAVEKAVAEKAKAVGTVVQVIPTKRKWPAPATHRLLAILSPMYGNSPENPAVKAFILGRARDWSATDTLAA